MNEQPQVDLPAWIASQNKTIHEITFQRDALIESIKCMNNALDNELPGDILLELRRAVSTVDEWGL